MISLHSEENDGDDTGDEDGPDSLAKRDPLRRLDPEAIDFSNDPVFSQMSHVPTSHLKVQRRFELCFKYGRMNITSMRSIHI